jgi:hypothetical protein
MTSAALPVLLAVGVSACVFLVVWWLWGSYNFCRADGRATKSTGDCSQALYIDPVIRGFQLRSVAAGIRTTQCAWHHNSIEDQS